MPDYRPASRLLQSLTERENPGLLNPAAPDFLFMIFGSVGGGTPVVTGPRSPHCPSLRWMATTESLLLTSRLLQRPERGGNLFEVAQQDSTGTRESGVSDSSLKNSFSTLSQAERPKSQKGFCSLW